MTIKKILVFSVEMIEGIDFEALFSSHKECVISAFEIDIEGKNRFGNSRSSGKR